MIISALTIPVALGFAALAVEGGLWYADHHQLRNVADAAALASGWARREGNSEQTAWTAAAPHVGFNADTDEIQIVSPPTSGAYAGDPDAIEVTVTRQRPLMLSALFLSERDVNIQARAIVRMRTRGSTCALSLDQGGAVTIADGATVNLNDCGLSINSHSPTALEILGNGMLNAAWTDVVGGIETAGGGIVNTTMPAESGTQRQEDPYKTLSAPETGSCTYTNVLVSNGGTASLAPGHYCGGLTIAPGGTAQLSPGTYIIDDCDLSVGSGGTLTGTDVTLVLTGSGVHYGFVTVNPGATVALSAPTTGPYAGIAVMEDPAAPSGGTSRFDGGSTMNFSGVIYLPRQNVEFSGGADSSNRCTRVIGANILFSGDTTLSNQCGAFNLPEESDDDPQLVG